MLGGGATPRPNGRGEKAGDGVRALQRGLRLISSLTVSGVSLTELAERAELPLATAARLLETCRAGAFVERGDDGLYRPGPTLLALTCRFDGDGELRHGLRRAMEELRDSTEETVALDIREGSRRCCVDSVESHLPVRRSHRMNEGRPFFTGAAGKVLIAFDTSEDLLKLVPPRRRLSGGPTETVDELAAECSRVRERGYAYAPMDVNREAWGLAAPVFAGEMLLGALVVSGPMTRAGDEHIRECIQRCREVAGGVSSWLAETLPPHPATHAWLPLVDR